jgi:protein-tyrosine phosphatase
MSGTARPAIRICFVCLGNICRSPTAEAVMRHLIAAEGLGPSFAVESAGTGDWHVGEARDRRSQAVGRARGIPLSGVAQQFTSQSFDRYDHVLAMDRSNRDELLRLARDDRDRAKVRLLRSFDPSLSAEEGSRAEVPDPYYGGPRGFEEVFEICDRACRGLLAELRKER